MTLSPAWSYPGALGRFTVGSSPLSAAFSADGSVIYVGDQSDFKIRAVETSGFTVTATSAALADFPCKILVLGSTALVSTASGLYKVSLPGLGVTGPTAWPVAGSCPDVVINPAGTKGYAVGLSGADIYPFDVASLTIGGAITLSANAVSAAFNPVGSKLFALSTDYQMTPIDVVSDTPGTAFAVGDGLPGSTPGKMLIKHDGSVGWLIQLKSPTGSKLWSFDPVGLANGTDFSPGLFSLSFPSGIVESPHSGIDPNELYVGIGTGGPDLLVVDANSGSLTHTLGMFAQSLGSLAVRPAGDLGAVPCFSPSELEVFLASPRALIASLSGTSFDTI